MFHDTIFRSVRPLRVKSKRPIVVSSLIKPSLVKEFTNSISLGVRYTIFSLLNLNFSLRKYRFQATGSSSSQIKVSVITRSPMQNFLQHPRRLIFCGDQGFFSSYRKKRTPLFL